MIRDIDFDVRLRPKQLRKPKVHKDHHKELDEFKGDIDGPVEYGVRSRLGAAFTKAAGHAQEKEWQFAWRSMSPSAVLRPVTVDIGSIEGFAELRDRESHLA